MRFSLRAAILVFALLAIGITVYPPWRWVPRLEAYVPGELPLTEAPLEHAPLWGPTTKTGIPPVLREERGIGVGPNKRVVTYDRFLDGGRLAIYYTLAALISAVVGVLVVRKPKSDRR
jgi:hypothetical protein